MRAVHLLQPRITLTWVSCLLGAWKPNHQHIVEVMSGLDIIVQLNHSCTRWAWSIGGARAFIHWKVKGRSLTFWSNDTEEQTVHGPILKGQNSLMLQWQVAQASIIMVIVQDHRSLDMCEKFNISVVDFVCLWAKPVLVTVFSRVLFTFPLWIINRNSLHSMVSSNTCWGKAMCHCLLGLSPLCM